MPKSTPYSGFISNTSLTSVLLVSISAERRSRSAVAVGTNESGEWEFDVRHEISKDGSELNVLLKSSAESSAMSIELQHQLQYDFDEPVQKDDLSQEVITRFLGESVIVTVAPYIRELVHTIGMRMQCDVPWLSIIGPQAMTPVDPA